MSRILAMAGSNSTTSINHKLVVHTISLLSQQEVRLYETAALDLPMYNVDIENSKGFPPGVEKLFAELQASDGWIFSVNEHNGHPSAATKSLLDWFSRKQRTFAEGIPILLMSTSPGRGGAAAALNAVAELLEKRFGADPVLRFSLPSFNHTFHPEEGIVDQHLSRDHQEILDTFLKAL